MMLNIVEGKFKKRKSNRPSINVIEKVCPVCGKYFIDTSKSHCKVTCGKKHSRDYRLFDITKKTEELIWMRIKTLRTQHKVECSEGEISEIFKKISQGSCEICGKKTDFRHLCIDHNHATLKYRGVICFNCNYILGHSSDDSRVLRNCINYLERV